MPHPRAHGRIHPLVTEPPSSPPRVLIVDDHPQFATVLRRALEMHGYACGIAATRIAALDAIEMHTFDVVVCDLHLRADNGLELLETIRARVPGIKRILMSGSILPEDPEVATSHLDGYLRKPFDLRDLQALLGRTR